MRFSGHVMAMPAGTTSVNQFIFTFNLLELTMICTGIRSNVMDRVALERQADAQSVL